MVPARLGEATWRDVEGATTRPVVAIPVGSCEQHGPHLPLDTDTRIAEALAGGLVGSLGPEAVVVGPSLAVTASGEHAAFPGTLSIGATALQTVLVELVRSADWSAGVVLVNGHGGNAIAVHAAVRTLTAEGRRVLAWFPRVAGGDAHAGHTETALMLAIAPQLVRRQLAAAGRNEPLGELLPELRRAGVRAVSANGVLGDPSGADATHGRVLLARLVDELVAAVDEWR